ncbi:MAG: hypothetical protein Q9164_000185 [Protoblastenia rupestris]
MGHRKVGQLASHQERFCPYAAVIKYPYRHLRGEVSQVVSDNFFANGAFRERGWSLYYIRTKLASTQKPLLLVPETEVEDLFREIRATLDAQITFPDITRDPGFRLGFQEEGSPRPRYLGRLTSQCGVLELEAMISVEGLASEDPEELDDMTFPAFRRKMEDAIESGKNKSKQAREKKRKDRIQIKKGWCAELKRAQCYLGLRPRRTAKYEEFHRDPNMAWEESQKAQDEYEKAAGISLPPLDLNARVPYSFDHNVVFVCVDLEAFEHDQRKITEIGVSTLDTSDIIKTPPGKGGENWMRFIRCRHFRIMEAAHLTNTEFITGCADRFQAQFGTSEWISIKEAPQVVAACFKHPFSAPGQYTPHPTNMRDVPRQGSNIQPLVKDDLEQKRNIILLGHDIRSDIGYLRKIGYDVGNLGNVVEAIDTVNMFRAYKHEQNPRSLGTVLLDFEIAGWNLHNAGNDAAYTTQALIAIALAARDPTNAPPRVPSQTQLKDAAEEAKLRIKEEHDDWQAADEEGGDGGEAIHLLPAAEMQDRMEFESAMRKGRKADERNEIRNARRDIGFRSGRRLARASRGAGSRGGGVRGRAACGGHAQEAKQDSNTMPFNFEALDEEMGFTGGGWDGASEDLIDASPSTNTHKNNNSNSNGDTSTLGSTDTKTSSKQESYLPPHLRIIANSKSKEPLVTTPQAPKVVLPEITDRMAKRLTLLDDAW